MAPAKRPNVDVAAGENLTVAGNGTRDRHTRMKKSKQDEQEVQGTTQKAAKRAKPEEASVAREAVLELLRASALQLLVETGLSCLSDRVHQVLRVTNVRGRLDIFRSDLPLRLTHQLLKGNMTPKTAAQDLLRIAQKFVLPISSSDGTAAPRATGSGGTLEEVVDGPGPLFLSGSHSYSCLERLADFVKLIEVNEKLNLVIHTTAADLRSEARHLGARGLDGQRPLPSLEVLYQDNELIVVNKPPGINSVPGCNEPTSMLEQLQALFPVARAVHRLDKETSGALIFALDLASARDLNRQFQERRVKKIYLAICSGHISKEEENGYVSLPLAPDLQDRPRQVVSHSKGKPAQTEYETLRRGYWKDERLCKEGSRSGAETINRKDSAKELEEKVAVSIVKLFPLTGRTHQLRVHMSAKGHPILGDTLYAPSSDQLVSSRLLLHSHSISFQHPSTREELEIVAPCPFLGECSNKSLD